VVTDPEAGLHCLERAAERSSDESPVPRLFLAEVLLERGRLDEGQALLEGALRADPGNLRARLGLGRLALLRQDWRAGLAHLQACRDDAHARKRASALCAEAWAQLGEPERARAEQRREADLPEDQAWPDPLHEEVLALRRGLRARYDRVDGLLQARRVPEAIRQLQEALDKYPQSVEGWVRLAGAWLQVNQPEKAESCYRKAVLLAPDLAQGWYRLGRTQDLLHSGEAEESFRQATRLKPDYAEAHFYLGQWLKEHGRRQEAAAEFRAALGCRPDYDRARAALQEIGAGEGKNR
jgi:cytochrome c-type biogenesis protein CcmH/NrfG